MPVSLRKTLTALILLLSIVSSVSAQTAEIPNKFQLAQSYLDSAASSSRLKDYENAIAYAQKSVDLYVQINYRKKSYLATAISCLAAYYSQRQQPGDLETAISLTEGCLKNFSPKSQEYIIVQYNLMSFYNRTGNTAKAQEIQVKLNKAKTSIFANNPMGYASIMSLQSASQARANDYQGAIDCGLQAASIFEKHNQANTTQYCRLMLNIATFYSKLQQYVKSIEILNRISPVLDSIEGKNGTNYRRCMTDLSNYSVKMGDLEKADDYMQKAGTGSGSEQVVSVIAATDLAKQADVLSENGNNVRALEKSLQSLDMFVQLGIQSDIAKALNTTSLYYDKCGQRDKAIEYCDSSLQLYESYGITRDKSSALLNMARYQLGIGDYDKALTYGLKAEEESRQTSDTLSQRYAFILRTLGVIYYKGGQGDVSKAYDLTDSGRRIYEKVYGPEHPDNVDFYFNLAIYAYYMGKVQQVQTNFHKALTMQTSIVRNNFSHLSAASRENYWQTKKKVFDQAQAFATMDNITDTLASDIYDALLFTKSILLNSEIDFRELLKSSSSETKGKYEQLVSLTKTLNQRQSAQGVTQTELNDLRYNIDILSREIVKSCKQYGDFTKNMNITCSDIVSSLRDDEVAMEIFDVSSISGGREYIAMYLKKDSRVPHVVRLFNLDKINALPVSQGDFLLRLKRKDGINQIFSDSQIADLVWTQLRKEWQGVSKVYFAPSGVFYTWGVEYLKFNDGTRMNDHYDFHRLTSTKLLSQRTLGSSTIHHATIFGGLDYDATPGDLLKAAQERKERLSADPLDEGHLLAMLDAESTASRTDSLDEASRDVEAVLTRGGELRYLPGTYTEAKTIYEIMLKNDVDADLYVHKEASEDAFRSLSGTDIDLIHIATHGISLDDAQSQNYTYRLNCGEKTTDSSPVYACLFMAGADNVIKLNRFTLPEGMHNGVLTDREISQMDLTSVRLAVLSACQTGLGQIKGDGVFGLQRGFKQAGVRSLLMSLWSVNDDATQQMMTGLYQRLSSGLTINQAFRQAQQELREGEYSDPYYWASFILLDQME